MRKILIMVAAVCAGLSGSATPAGALFSATGMVIAILADDLYSGEAVGHLNGSGTFVVRSQKDSALFPGPDDPREFWQRAEDRNRHTAALYNQIGLPEYFALEGFVRWDGVPL